MNVTSGSVVFVVPTGWLRGGAERMLLDFIRFRPDSAPPYHAVLLEEGDLAGHLAAAGASIECLPMPRLRALHRWPRPVATLRKSLLDHRPERVVSWMTKAHFFVCAALRGTGVPLAWWQHGFEPDWMGRLAWRLPADWVGFSSEGAAAAHAGLRPQRRAWVVRPGTNVSRFVPPSPALRTAARIALGIPPDSSVFVTVARLEPGKGIDVMLRALSILRRRGVRVHYVVVGGEHPLAPEYAERLRALSSSLELQDVVLWLGHLSDVRPALNAADVFVDPSISPYALNIVLVEAAGVGLPIVAAAHGGPLEVLRSCAGVGFRPGDAPHLATVLEELASDPSLRSRLGERARFGVLADFDASAAASAFAEQVAA